MDNGPMLRTLLTGEEVISFADTKILTVKTKCPEKWKLVDMETGEEYIGRSTDGKNSWRKIQANARKTA